MNKKYKVTVKTFVEYILSDSNKSGVNISPKAVEEMSNQVFTGLELLLNHVTTLPAHCIYNYEKEGLNSADTIPCSDIELVPYVEEIIKKY